MDRSEGSKTPVRQVRLEDGEGRPAIKEYKNKQRFRVNDQVYIRSGLRGPYTVCKGEGKKYILEQEDGTKVDGGKEFNESELDHSN